MRLIKSSSLVFSGPEVRFHPDSDERLTDFLEIRFGDEEDGGELLDICVGDGIESGLEPSMDGGFLGCVPRSLSTPFIARRC